MGRRQTNIAAFVPIVASRCNSTIYWTVWTVERARLQWTHKKNLEYPDLNGTQRWVSLAVYALQHAHILGLGGLGTRKWKPILSHNATETNVVVPTMLAYAYINLTIEPTDRCDIYIKCGTILKCVRLDLSNVTHWRQYCNDERQKRYGQIFRMENANTFPVPNIFCIDHMDQM